ncbi:MAG: hypothetical protein KF890_14260 [Nitrospira sp.]|nr:hypothetical protein [Nitrospira sp.]
MDNRNIRDMPTEVDNNQRGVSEETGFKRETFTGEEEVERWLEIMEWSLDDENVWDWRKIRRAIRNSSTDIIRWWISEHEGVGSWEECKGILTSKFPHKISEGDVEEEKQNNEEEAKEYIASKNEEIREAV